MLRDGILCIDDNHEVHIWYITPSSAPQIIEKMIRGGYAVAIFDDAIDRVYELLISPQSTPDEEYLLPGCIMQLDKVYHEFKDGRVFGGHASVKAKPHGKVEGNYMNLFRYSYNAKSRLPNYTPCEVGTAEADNALMCNR
jgi:hypothetical protein